MQRRAGFTLLEVLAAVAVIGLTFTLLARANIEGLRAEGVAERKLEASLLADRLLVLAELESQLAAGTAPPVGRSEREDQGFRVLLDVTPLELSLPQPAGQPVPGSMQGRALGPSESAGPSLLAAPGTNTPTLLRRVHLEVAWFDGISEESVRRDTIVFDAVQAAPLLEGLAAAGAPQAGEQAATSESEGSPEEEPEFDEPLIPIPGTEDER
jgi:prepilin-type N-terminal cleavage/methylation domain-containing protein